MNFISLAFKSAGKLNSQRWKFPASPLNHLRSCLTVHHRRAGQIKKLDHIISTPRNLPNVEQKGLTFLLKKKKIHLYLPGTEWSEALWITHSRKHHLPWSPTLAGSFPDDSIVTSANFTQSPTQLSEWEGRFCQSKLEFTSVLTFGWHHLGTQNVYREHRSLASFIIYMALSLWKQCKSYGARKKDHDQQLHSPTVFTPNKNQTTLFSIILNRNYQSFPSSY